MTGMLYLVMACLFHATVASQPALKDDDIDSMQQLASYLLAVAPVMPPSTRHSVPAMKFPKIEEARKLETPEEIKAEIDEVKKQLFDLRRKVRARVEIKPHMFTHLKRRRRHLMQVLNEMEQ
mmetsp:Transcript_57261/g.91036  ORF Transcript_57261/g.91036 Transcript_57261/m.91036 type:complete len:122 (-) Transcript_57261:129-494(-)|eukprot:CAMPEP_0169103402 /NCGR_PEP_ID=MMETSP1015-20121227/22698_1 /TAXON_ID=342587 /ORGANISM="Karlodinium micrum, Strain CCMP2283" /LENGTH=121 /DNA_ID=CAMNT_0009164601 /DNA_START=56 /DNA_END=421 /DNA_ORIENTATION=-